MMFTRGVWPDCIILIPKVEKAMSTDESIKLEEVDFEEPPPTDPCPGVLPRQSIRVDPSDDDLEKRLAWLAKEVRTTSAEQAKIRREKTVLERREYKNASISTNSKQPQDVNLPKVTLAVGIDPQRDPTLVGRQISEHQWDFDVSDPDELVRTLPLDTQSANAEPLPFRSSADKLVAHSGASSRAFIGLCMVFFGGLLLQYFVHSSARAAFAEIPMAKRSLGYAAMLAESHYNSAREAESARLLIPQIIQSPPPVKNTPELPIAPSAIAPQAAPTSTIFRYVKPSASIQSKASLPHSAAAAPSSALTAPVAKDTLGF